MVEGVRVDDVNFVDRVACPPEDRYVATANPQDWLYVYVLFVGSYYICVGNVSLQRKD